MNKLARHKELQTSLTIARNGVAMAQMAVKNARQELDQFEKVHGNVTAVHEAKRDWIKGLGARIQSCDVVINMAEAGEWNDA
jgi:hypothetical protein